MTENVALLIVIGLIIVVTLALVLNRYFKARWGDKEVQVGRTNTDRPKMTIEAQGAGTSQKNLKQIDETGAADMEIKAKAGARQEGITQAQKKESIKKTK